MARGTAKAVQETRSGLLEAATQVLRVHGFAGLTTRAVAKTAGAPMSQIQYHFGSKEGLVLAVFEHMNAQLLARQSDLFVDPDLRLSEQWELACDYLDEDLASGYVGVLQELLAAGWTNPEIGEVVGDGLMGWVELLGELARRALDIHGPVVGFRAEDIATLVSASFIGAEALLLLGLEERGLPVRSALRCFAVVIRTLEEAGTGSEGGDDARQTAVS